MIKIKFKNKSSMEDVQFSRINQHVVQALGSYERNTNGFYTYDETGVEQLGDFTDYTTIYRQLNNGYQFSNDGSVWVEPDKSVEIKVNWSGEDDDTQRPTEIDVTYVVDGVSSDITILKTDNWNKIVTIKESKELVVTSAENVENYDKTINNNVIYYTYSAPTWRDKAEAQLTYTAMMTDTLLEE